MSTQIFTGIAIYFVTWWICLFLVLPFGVKNQIDEGKWEAGTERGAPAGVLRLWPKLIATTLLSLVVTAVLLWLLGNPGLREYWS